MRIAVPLKGYISVYVVIGVALLLLVGLSALTQTQAITRAVALQGALSAELRELAQMVERLVAIYSLAGFTLLLAMWWFCVRRIAHPLLRMTRQLKVLQERGNQWPFNQGFFYASGVKEIDELAATFERYENRMARHLLSNKLQKTSFGKRPRGISRLVQSSVQQSQRGSEPGDGWGLGV